MYTDWEIIPKCSLTARPKAPLYLAAVAVGGPPAAEGAFGQRNVLDDLGEVQVDLQQQVLAAFTDHAERRKDKRVSEAGLGRHRSHFDWSCRLNNNTLYSVIPDSVPLEAI